MTNIYLESLPYPMFTTTEGEKECLRKALPYISCKDCDYYLCVIVDEIVGGEHAAELVDKITWAVSSQGVYQQSSTLCNKLEFFPEEKDMAEMRRIWIRKLLEYTGE